MLSEPLLQRHVLHYGPDTSNTDSLPVHDIPRKHAIPNISDKRLPLKRLPTASMAEPTKDLDKLREEQVQDDADILAEIDKQEREFDKVCIVQTIQLIGADG